MIPLKKTYSQGRILLLFCAFLFIYEFEALAQCNDNEASDDLSWNYDDTETDGFSLSKFLSNTFTPQIIIDTKKIRNYIRDERFQILRARCGDMRALDAIYLKSLRIADYNIARTLFLSLMAVLEHRKIDFKMPIIKSLEIPLTFEEDSIFYARIKHLPIHIYTDTPNGPEGDRDKLQHFFASAYLVYASEAPQFSRTAGDLVEWSEAKFVVGGSDDPRDKRTNKQGESFGRDLLVVKTLLPSDYLTFPSEDRK